MHGPNGKRGGGKQSRYKYDMLTSARSGPPNRIHDKNITDDMARAGRETVSACITEHKRNVPMSSVMVPTSPSELARLEMPMCRVGGAAIAPRVHQLRHSFRGIRPWLGPA